MTTPSFEHVNYALRPNKNVERKLMVEGFRTLQPRFNLREYCYVGLGSMWFVDFILVHKNLLIETMYSIERPDYAKRAEFNKPFACVEVISGETTEVLPNLPLQERRSIVWLDYDSGIKGPALQDIEIVCNQTRSGSVMIVTINADRRRLPKKDEQGQTLTLEQSLQRCAPGLVPTSVRNLSNYRPKRFAKLLGRILFTHTKNVLRVSGRRERFYPLFNFYYKDTSPMITIGGMIVDERDREVLEQCNLLGQFDYMRGESQFVIDVPPLTSKEKLELDQLLPAEQPPDLRQVEERGFTLKQSQLNSYHRFYRHYPIFTEFQF